MSRLMFQIRFIDRYELFKKMRAKHVADGGASVLNGVIAENAINLATDDTAANNAKAQHDTFDTLSKSSEKKFRARNVVLALVLKDHKACVQFLKKFYKKNIAKLGDWSVTVNGNKIAYPADFDNLKIAIVLFIDKHFLFPVGTSPLESFLTENTIDLAQNKIDINAAKTTHDEAEQDAIDSETARAQRDTLMETVIADTRLLGGFLVNHFTKNANKAGDWGFIIDNSPQGTKTRQGILNFGSSKVLTKLAKDGVLINESDFDIELYKGKTATGTPIILHPGVPFVITQGFGTVTLKNPNLEKKAAYQGVFHK